MNKNNAARSTSLEELMALPRKFCHVGAKAGYVGRIFRLALLLGMVAAATDVAARDNWPARIGVEKQDFDSACMADRKTSSVVDSVYVNTCSNCHINGIDPQPQTAVGNSVCRVENDNNRIPLCTITADIDFKTFCNTPVAGMFTLTVSRGQGGTVKSQPPGIDCGVIAAKSLLVGPE